MREDELGSFGQGRPLWKQAYQKTGRLLVLSWVQVAGHESAGMAVSMNTCYA